jgi:hypothetical protein
MWCQVVARSLVSVAASAYTICPIHGQFVMTFAFVMTEIAFAASRSRVSIVVATENSYACMASALNE